MKKIRIFPILTVIPALFSSSCLKKDTRTDVEHYIDILQECRDENDFHTELYIFPNTIENREVKSFYYAHMDDLFTGSFLMYLVLEYQEDDYISEKERLVNVKAEFEGRGTKSIIAYPEQNLYLTIKQNARFEYAMYNDEKLQIAFISNQIFDWENTPVDGDFVLPEANIPTELDDGDNMYNMYYWFEDDVGYYIGE